MGTEAFEKAVVAVERAVEHCRGQELTAAEFGWEVVDALLEYLRHEDPRDDIELFIGYAVDWATEMGDLGLFADRLLAGEVERRLRWCLQRQELRLVLDDLLAELDEGLSQADPAARERLVELCASGGDTHRRVFGPHHWGGEVIDLAAAHRRVDALKAALAPSSWARLASRRRDGGRTYRKAFDHLAHLAADPVDRLGTAAWAREALVELAGYFDLVGDAAVRLPPHLVEDALLEELTSIHERRVELLGRDGLTDPFPTEHDNRQTAVLRGVLFQIQDARRLTEAVELGA